MSDVPEIVQFLRARVPLFAGFADDRLSELVRGSRATSYEANEAIAHHGADATHFGVILSGTVATSVAGDGGVRQDLGRLSEGDTFGDMALMTGDKLAADFVADSRCEVLSTSMPLAGARQHEGANTRSPLISTTHARQLPSAR